MIISLSGSLNVIYVVNLAVDPQNKGYLNYD
jgi:hypothetical protein